MASHRPVVSVPIFVGSIIAAAIIGASIVLVVTKGGRQAEQPATTAATSSPADSSTNAPSSTTSTAGATMVTSPTTTAAPPRGSLRAIRQGTVATAGQCLAVNVRFINNSDAEIVKVTFAARQARYYTLRDYDPQTTRYPPDGEAATPPPTTLSLSLPAYHEQVLHVRMCSPTAPPDTRYDLSIEYPTFITFEWASGHIGSAPYER